MHHGYASRSIGYKWDNQDMRTIELNGEIFPLGYDVWTPNDDIVAMAAQTKNALVGTVLEVLIAEPTQAHYDPSQITLSIVNTDAYIENKVIKKDHALPAYYRVPPGFLGIGDRKDRRVPILTCGAIAQVSIGENGVVQFLLDSVAPIFLLPDIHERSHARTLAEYAKACMASQNASERKKLLLKSPLDVLDDFVSFGLETGTHALKVFEPGAIGYFEQIRAAIKQKKTIV